MTATEAPNSNVTSAQVLDHPKRWKLELDCGHTETREWRPNKPHPRSIICHTCWAQTSTHDDLGRPLTGTRPRTHHHAWTRHPFTRGAHPCPRFICTHPGCPTEVDTCGKGDQ